MPARMISLEILQKAMVHLIRRQNMLQLGPVPLPQLRAAKLGSSIGNRVIKRQNPYGDHHLN